MKKCIALLLGITMILMMMSGCAATAGTAAASSAAAPSATASAAAASVAATDTSAQASSAGPVTITYQTASASDMFTKAFAEYQKTHPNVKLQVQTADAQTYNEKILAEASTKTLPDVMWWNSRQYVGNWDTGAWLDLTDIMSSKFNNRFIDGTFLMSKTDSGKVTCFPCEMQIQGFLVNTDLFKKYNLEVPKTFDDLLKCAKVFKDNKIALFGNGTADKWPTWGWYHWFELWGINEQADQIYSTHTLKFADSDAAKALSKMAELYAAGAFPYSNSTTTYEQTKTMFLAGKCAMMTTSTDWLTGIVGSDLDKTGAIQYNFGATFADSKYDQNTCVKMDGNGYGINSKITDDKKAVLLDFFDWFYSDKGANVVINDGLILPITFKVTGTLTPLTQSIMDLTLKTTRKGIITSDYAAIDRWGRNTDIWLESGQYLATMVNGCIDGSITAKDLPTYLTKYDGLIDKAIAAYAKVKK